MKSGSRRGFLNTGLKLGTGLLLWPATTWSSSSPVHPLEQKIGRIFFLNMYWRTPPDFFLRIVENYRIGGVYLDKNCLIDRDTCLRAVNRLQSAARAPLFVITDCEGGVVNRLRKIQTLDSPETIGGWFASGKIDEAGLQKIYLDRTRLMRELGITFNFDPVLDLSGPYIKTRSFGSDPELLAKMARVVTRAYREGRVHATAKHFPGMGTVRVNPHLEVLPVIKGSIEELSQRELLPFLAAIEEGISSILVGHPFIQTLDPKLPASLSPTVIKEFIRKDLKYEGVIWPDSLTMGMVIKYYKDKGITGDRQIQAAAIAAIKAGVDQIFNFRFDNASFPSLARAIRAAVERGEFPESRIDEAVARIDRLHQQSDH